MAVVSMLSKRVSLKYLLLNLLRNYHFVVSTYDIMAF